MRSRKLAALIFGCALALSAPAIVIGAEDEALAALRALAADPAAPQPAALAALEFTDATYLLDDLSPGEIRRLSEYLEKGRLTLPPDVAGAIEARTLKIQGPGDQGGR
ncbi:hypothetical protein G5B40_07215 [Pikeienuella piscinae]|uniref:Helix-hairpin-helix domain-containing protein n=1 Tax=Pikeienuella piscinae TaxID=2748098 RepID=A0A7L5BUG7_9RHOB|nr:hypothetical protein [Pikeienuella piscinae]QIE55262.1 hypothetical protein G5B40_07215 [Pikeienuella piscinae]